MLIWTGLIIVNIILQVLGGGLMAASVNTP
jgi:hypothetical protein